MNRRYNTTFEITNTFPEIAAAMGARGTEWIDTIRMVRTNRNPRENVLEIIAHNGDQFTVYVEDLDSLTVVIMHEAQRHPFLTRVITDTIDFVDGLLGVSVSDSADRLASTIEYYMMTTAPAGV